MLRRPIFLAAVTAHSQTRGCWGSSTGGWGSSDATTPADAFDDGEAGSPVASGWGAPPPPPVPSPPSAGGSSGWGDSGQAGAASGGWGGASGGWGSAPAEPAATPSDPSAAPFTPASDFKPDPNLIEPRLLQQRCTAEELLERVEAWVTYTVEMRQMATDTEDQLMTAFIMRMGECPVPRLLDIVEIRWPDDTEEKWAIPVKTAIRDRIMEEANGLPALLVPRCLVIMGLYGKRRRDVELFAKLGKLMVVHINEIRDPHTLCYTLVALQQSRIKPPESFLGLLSRRLPVLNKRTSLEPMPAFRAFMFYHRSDYPMMNPYRFLADRIMDTVKVQLKALENRGGDFIPPKRIQKLAGGEGDDDHLSGSDFDILKELKASDLAGGGEDNPFQVNNPDAPETADGWGGDAIEPQATAEGGEESSWGATPAASDETSTESPEIPPPPTSSWGSSDAPAWGAPAAPAWGSQAATPEEPTADATGISEELAAAAERKAKEREEGAILEASLHAAVPVTVREGFEAVTPGSIKGPTGSGERDNEGQQRRGPVIKQMGYTESERARLRLLHLSKLRPQSFMKFLWVLGHRRAPKQQYLKPLINDVLLPVLPHLTPPALTRFLRAIRLFAPEEKVLLQGIFDHLVKLGPERAMLCDILEMLRSLANPTTETRVLGSLNIAPFLQLVKEAVRDDSRLRPKDMMMVSHDVMHIYRKLDLTDYTSAGDEEPVVHLSEDAKRGLQELADLIEHFAGRMTFLLELGVLAIPHADLMLDLCTRIKAKDTTGSIAGLRDATRRVTADGEEAYFEMIDIDVREIFFRTQVVNSWETFENYRPLPALLIQDYKACLDHMRCDYIVEAVHLYNQAYPSKLNRPIRRVLSRFIITKLDYELQMMAGAAKPMEPPPAVFKVKPKDAKDQPTVNKSPTGVGVSPSTLWGQSDTHTGNTKIDFNEMLQEDMKASRGDRRKYAPFEPSAPRFQQMYFTPATFLKFYNMIVALPCKRVLNSDITWRFLRDKARTLKLPEEDVPASCEARMSDNRKRREAFVDEQLYGGRRAERARDSEYADRD